MPLADTFRQQAEALNAAAEASDRLTGSLGRLSEEEAGILALQRQAAAQARIAPARLLGPDGRLVRPPPPPVPGAASPEGPFEPLPASLQPRTTSGPAGGVGGAVEVGDAGGLATGGSGGRKSRTGSFPWELWAEQHCKLVAMALPDPDNAGRTIQREAWDCRSATGDPAAVYLVPKYVTATRGRTRSASSGGGGGGGTGGAPPFAFPERRTVFGGAEPAGTAFVGLGSQAPTTPSPGEREIVRAVQAQTTRLEVELRAIRQNGSRYRGGVNLRAEGLV